MSATEYTEANLQWYCLLLSLMIYFSPFDPITPLIASYSELLMDVVREARGPT